MTAVSNIFKTKFLDFIATGRSLIGKTPAVNLGEISSSTLYDSRLDLGRAIGAVVKWDKAHG